MDVRRGEFHLALRDCPNARSAASPQPAALGSAVPVPATAVAVSTLLPTVAAAAAQPCELMRGGRCIRLVPLPRRIMRRRVAAHVG